MSDPADALRPLLRRLAGQTDPGDRVATLAELQRATRTALAGAVAEWRETTGAHWTTIAARVGLNRTTLHRQLAAGAIQVPDHDAEEEKQSA